MAAISDMVCNRLPDEAALFAASLGTFIEETLALAGYEGVEEAAIPTTVKSLVADMVAKALLIPARSHYKKEMSKVEGDQAGKAEFVDKLKFLDKIEEKLDEAIALKKNSITAGSGSPLAVVDPACPMMVVD